MVDLEAAKRNLLERRQTLVTRTGKIQRDLQRLPDADSQERVSETENDEVLERLDDTERAELARIDAALRRIDAGSYGSCESCGEPIAEARLEVAPEAVRCVGCA